MSTWGDERIPCLALGEQLFPEGEPSSLYGEHGPLDSLTVRIEATAREVPAAVCRAREEVRAILASY